MDFSRQLSPGKTEQFHEVHRERAYGAIEVRTLLESTGWEVERLYDGLHHQPAPPRKASGGFFVARRV